MEKEVSHPDEVRQAKYQAAALLRRLHKLDRRPAVDLRKRIAP
jgi:hypothetical protein